MTEGIAYILMIGLMLFVGGGGGYLQGRSMSQLSDLDSQRPASRFAARLAARGRANRALMPFMLWAVKIGLALVALAILMVFVREVVK